MLQTPEEFADDIARTLTSPLYLNGANVFAIVVWALPEGVRHIDDVPRSSPARATYIQCGGSTGLMLLLCVKGGEVLVVAVCELG